ncbi:MAG: dipeptide ABC transporter ATP-binding protein [Chitinophagaceae bacterium]
MKYYAFTPFITVENLSVSFVTDIGKTQASQDVSFTIEQGKTLALVGESGSGKSVSAMSMMQLLASPPAHYEQGKILFHIENKTLDILSLTTSELNAIRGKHMGFIFQEPMTSLNPLMQVGKQIKEVLQTHTTCTEKQIEEKTIDLLQDVQLPNPHNIMYRYPHELSGGQKQRIMIAIAIACNPALLIADEPTTALDVHVQKSILLLLRSLQKKYGMSILFITHDLNLVRDFADDTLVLFKSQVVEYAKTDILFASPQEKYTQGLIACRPSMDKRYKFLPTVEDYLEDNMNSTVTISSEDFEKINHNQLASGAILDIEDVNIWYPTQISFFGKKTAWYKAVNGVNIQIHKGETLGLVGESGCGKTTLGKAIVKLTDITSGDILYKKQSIKTLKRDALREYRKEVQMIFQDPYSSLNPSILIGKAIEEPMHVYGLNQSKERKEKTEELLQKVGLLPIHYNRYPHEFSGGQRQRICIARALALQPSFILCDESVSALDVSVQAQVLNLLTTLKDEYSLSYLFISHDMSVVKHISNRVAVMKKGKIVELNDADNLYQNPQHDYTKKLLDAIKL